jgi:Fe-S-cluster containining protein
MTNKIEAEALQALEEKPWFAGGLRFTCTGCGKCCTGPADSIYLSRRDVSRLSKALRLPVDTFIRDYTRLSEGRRVLLDKPSSADCVFLSGTACSVYDGRPTQCRTYPFWLTNILEPEDWTAAAELCEGINHPDAPLLSPAEILEQCRSDLENETLTP